MKEITVVINAFGKEWEIKIDALEDLPQDRLKTLAINKMVAEIKDILLQENEVIEKTSFMTSKDYAL